MAGFAVLDFETTGLAAEYNRVVEVGVVLLSTANDRHDTYSFLLDVSDYLRSQEDMGDWADRITAIADENFDPSVGDN